MKYKLKLYIKKIIGKYDKHIIITRIRSVYAKNKEEAIEKAYEEWYTYSKPIPNEQDQLITKHKFLKVVRMRKCSLCNGTGHLQDCFPNEECDVCEGTGEVN